MAHVKPPTLPMLTQAPWSHIAHVVLVQVMLPSGLQAPEAAEPEVEEEELEPEAAGAAGATVATGAGAAAAAEEAAGAKTPAAWEEAAGAAATAEEAAGAAPAAEPLPEDEEDEDELPPGTVPPVRPVKLSPVKLGSDLKSPLALAPEMVIGAQFMYVSVVTFESQTQAKVAAPSVSWSGIGMS